MILPTQQTPQQATGPPKRQRTASQRAQQQKARIQKQKELEALKLREEREYMVKFAQLRRTVRALVFKNGALADEVARLKMQIDVCREERKMVAKRVQHYERNRIRRLQTHERKAQAKAAAAQLQAEQKSTETTEEDENSKSIDVVLPLNDVRSAQLKQMPTNFQSMQEPGFFPNAAESAPPKSRTPTQTPRKRSRSSKEPGEQAPAKRRKSNGTASTTPMETSPSPSQKQPTPVQQPVVSEMTPPMPAEKSHSPSPTAKLVKRPVGRLEKRTPPITSTAAEDALLLRTRTVSTSLPAATNTPTTPSRPEFTRFPTNFLERAETPADKLEEPRESEYDRMSIEHQTPASKLSNDRHLRSNSSTADGGVSTEIRQRANSRTSRRPPRHSLTPSSMADSSDMPSNSASPVPTSTEGTPTNTPTVVTRRRAAEIAEIATSSTTPPMKTRSKTKHSS
ncbi:Transforming growth factor beta regulator 1 [Aphelenchoides bicaudatus]|nr:Transforming growth factor beta regulator 1 [Aphelenchoides bicaudatus]